MPYLRHTITVDFSGDYDRQIVGVGIVIQESRQRGRRGPIVEELSESVQGIELGEGEKYAVLRALELAAERGIKDLQIRSDYNAMRRKLRENYRRGGRWSPGGLDERIFELAKNFDRVHFGGYRGARTSERINWRGVRETCLVIIACDPSRLTKSVRLGIGLGRN